MSDGDRQGNRGGDGGAFGAFQSIFSEGVRYLGLIAGSLQALSGGASGGAGSVSSVATAGLASGGPITTAGTITVPLATQVDQETGASLTTAVTPGRQQYHPSAAKAWVSVGVSGNVQASYNTTSVTDAATGSITANWTVALSSASYCAVYMVETPFNLTATVNGQTASTLSARTWNSAGALFDPTLHYVAAFGDQ